MRSKHLLHQYPQALAAEDPVLEEASLAAFHLVSFHHLALDHGFASAYLCFALFFDAHSYPVP